MTGRARRGTLVRTMRILIAALVGILGLPPCSGARASHGKGHLVVENGSSVDLSFEFTAAGERVAGCFWVLKGRSTTFELPSGDLEWAYTISGTRYSSRAVILTSHPSALSCRTTQARLGGDVATCESADAPAVLPPQDSIATLTDATFGFLEALGKQLQKGDEKSLGGLVRPPFDVEWAGETPGARRVKSARHLIEVREHLELDTQSLQAARARAADPRTGEDDCVKHEVDWSKGGPALGCEGRSVTLLLRPTAACGKFPHINSWQLTSEDRNWQLTGKGVKTP